MRMGLALGLALALAAIAACSPDVEQSPAGGDDAPDASMPPMTGGCEGVPETGVCRGGSEIARCTGGEIVVEACPAGCVDGATSCNEALSCDGVGPLGRCDGDVLSRCDGTPARTDCAAAGKMCGYVDDTAGYGCVASTAALRVAGKITWDDRPLSPGMLGAAVVTPARGTMVAVVDDATDALVATVSTADDGTYVAHYTAPASGRVRVVAYSRSRFAHRPARVRDTAGYLHAVGSPAFAAASSTVDIHIAASSTAVGAWNSLDNAITAMDWIRARGVTTISPVYIYWQSSTSSGSYYQGGNNELHLDGDDGYDDVVALHELGHYVQDEYSDSDNPGGAHDGSPADPRLAWGEGGATWFAIAVRDAPYYIDYSAGGGWSVELEQRVHAASLTGAMSQNVSEWMVAEVMWDITDSAVDGHDNVAGGAANVWDVMVGYVASPQADRGRAGLDLVEFLDGWFVEHGMTSCGPIRSLLRDHYRFPYDLAGPAGTCP